MQIYFAVPVESLSKGKQVLNSTKNKWLPNFYVPENFWVHFSLMTYMSNFGKAKIISMSSYALLFSELPLKLGINMVYVYSRN